MSDHCNAAPFLAPAAKETHVQRVLREALDYVAAHGALHWIEATATSQERVVAVCGFPLQASAPDWLTLIAARLVVQEITRGFYESDGIEDEYDCLGWDYAEVAGALNTYIAECDLTDSYICAVIEKAYERVASPSAPLGGGTEPLITTH